MEFNVGNGKVTLIDEGDLWLARPYRWRVYNGYVRLTFASGVVLFLHRLIAAPEAGQVVDHINGDTLDNRRANLRCCTRAQNQLNRGFNKNNKSGYKGVHFAADRNKWRARITRDQVDYRLGFFDTAEQAGEAYRAAAERIFGEFARKVL